MNKCDNCKIRQRMARAFDLHWMGEDDCPFGCPVDAPTTIEADGNLQSDRANANNSEVIANSKEEEGET